MKNSYSPATPATQVRRLLPVASPLEVETLLFMFVSALDVILTYYLLCHPEVHFIETNPLARYFIYGWGLKGMVLFKSVLVGSVILMCQVIARERMDLARGVLNFGTGIVTLVVVYSVSLICRYILLA